MFSYVLLESSHRFSIFLVNNSSRNMSLSSHGLLSYTINCWLSATVGITRIMTDISRVADTRTRRGIEIELRKSVLMANSESGGWSKQRKIESWLYTDVWYSHIAERILPLIPLRRWRYPLLGNNYSFWMRNGCLHDGGLFTIYGAACGRGLRSLSWLTNCNRLLLPVFSIYSSDRDQWAYLYSILNRGRVSS